MDARLLWQRYGDALVAVVSAAVFVTEVALWQPADQARAVPGALLATLSLVLRRRSPLLVLVLVGVGIEVTTRSAPGLDNESAGLLIAFFVALYSVGRHARGVEAWLGVVGLLVYGAQFVASDGDAFHLADVLFAMLLVGTPWAIGLALRLRSERETVLHEENLRLQEDKARAVAEERSRIARELHDVVSHAISVTVLQARGARRSLDADPQAVRRALDAIEHTNAAALGDMRRLLAVLRDTEPGPAADDHHAPQPSLAHLDTLVEQVRASGVPVAVEQVGGARELPPGIDLSAYRIVQEALTNVLRHAADARVTVRLEYSDDALTVAVTDDGIPGPVSDEPGGHGLIGIRERVSVVGGDVEAGPGPDGGFTVRARLPYALELS